jgi:prephenate dehydrogenase
MQRHGVVPTASERPGQSDAGPFGRIAIVGFGLIGASIGLAARRRWPAAELIAVDRPDVIQSAIRTHAADIGGGDLSLCGDADLVVLAAPVQTNITILADLPGYVSGSAVVTDVGSTKRRVAAVGGQLPARLSFVGGHPLAGAATGGLEAARSDLFAGRSWILTPVDDREEAVEKLSTFIDGLGARVHVMTPDAHDSVVAYLSHLPQLTATALMHLVGERTGAGGLALAGRGLQDTTRLASSPADIWRDIAATNHDHIAQAIDELVDILLQMKNGGDTLGKTFESAARWKQVLEAARAKT